MTTSPSAPDDATSASTVLDLAGFDRRIIEPDDFVADPSAFVDV